MLKLGRIWALNVGENFATTIPAWRRFTVDLLGTEVSYAYVSELHLYRAGNLKIEMREAIRVNRILGPPRDTLVSVHVTNMWCASAGIVVVLLPRMGTVAMSTASAQPGWQTKK